MENKSPSSMPIPKMQAVGFAAGLTAIAVWILSLYGVDMPPEAAAGLTAILGFAAGYITPPKGL